MDKKLIEYATQAGFPLNKHGGAHTFSIQEKTGLIGYDEIELDSKLQKFADLLFDDFVSQWWVKRHGIRVENP